MPLNSARRVTWCSAYKVTTLTHHNPRPVDRSRGHLILESKNFDQSDNNGAILTILLIIKNVMASDSVAKCSAIFINDREATVIKSTLEETGHPQLKTPIPVENSTCDGIMNKKIQQKIYKEMDMHLYL